MLCRSLPARFAYGNALAALTVPSMAALLICFDEIDMACNLHDSNCHLSWLKWDFIQYFFILDVQARQRQIVTCVHAHGMYVM